MGMPKWIMEKEVSEIVGRAPQTLRNDRHKCRGIPYTKIGSSIRYKLSDVLDFMESHKVVPDGGNGGDQQGYTGDE